MAMISDRRLRLLDEALLLDEDEAAVVDVDLATVEVVVVDAVETEETADRVEVVRKTTTGETTSRRF